LLSLFVSPVQLKERIMLELERDHLFRNDDAYDLTRPEVRERTMAKAKTMLHVSILIEFFSLLMKTTNVSSDGQGQSFSSEAWD
jgi:acyl-CoA oxidase